MKKKKIIYILLSILIATALIIFAAYIIKENAPKSPEISTTPVVRVEDPIPENSDLNNVKISLVNKYYIPYKNVQLSGNNLIDGSYANRTVYVFTITGVKDLNTYFKSLKIYEKDKLIPADITARQYNDDEVLVFAVCDNALTLEGMIVSMTIMEAKTGEKMTFSKELSNEELIINETVTAGSIFKVSDNGFWYRSENTEGSNKVSKNNNKGPYYEYTRTLNFYTFGAENNIDIEQLKINSQIPYEYDIFVSVAEKSGSEYIEYKAENTTGEKKISVVLKIYTNEMDDTINKEIIENIEKSYFEYNGHKIHLTDGTIKEELRK